MDPNCLWGKQKYCNGNTGISDYLCFVNVSISGCEKDNGNNNVLPDCFFGMSIKLG